MSGRIRSFIFTKFFAIWITIYQRRSDKIKAKKAFALLLSFCYNISDDNHIFR